MFYLIYSMFLQQLHIFVKRRCKKYYPVKIINNHVWSNRHTASRSCCFGSAASRYWQNKVPKSRQRGLSLVTSPTEHQAVSLEYREAMKISPFQEESQAGWVSSIRWLRGFCQPCQAFSHTCPCSKTLSYP